MDRQRTMGICIIGVVLIATATGCRHGSGEADASSEPPPATVQATFESMRDWYAQGAYARLRPHIDPAQRDNLIDLLLALDELMAANEAVLEAIRAACPGADPAQFDLSYLRDWMELFSQEVRIVHKQEQDVRAVLTVQVGTRLPLERLEFEIRSGRWIYLPGLVPREAASAVRRLTVTLDRFRVTVASQRPVTEDGLLQEYWLRVRPRLAQITRTAREADASASVRPDGHAVAR
jgi:hypothetical protein